MQRDVVACGQQGGIASVPVEEVDHAHDPSRDSDPCLDLWIVDGIDKPHAAVIHKRVRRALEAWRLIGDPAEAEGKLVAKTRAHGYATLRAASFRTRGLVTRGDTSLTELNAKGARMIQ